MNDIARPILAPMMARPSRAYRAVCVALGAVLLWSMLAWAWQIAYGLGETGLNTPVFWGLYLVNFVFFIGISHAGTLISSILRITDTAWRRPFTRLAEAITVFSLPFGATCVIVDLGRPERLFNVIFYPHFSSAILWDVVCISTYLITSILYFYMALVPDIAVCRDRLTGASPFRRRVYRGLALGWEGTESQHRMLSRIMTGMSIFLFALVISVHTNVSFVFGMTTKPGWHTPLISPFFVLGAIYSGVAAVIFFAVIFRKIFHLEAYLTPRHFNSCAKFLLALCCFWLYAMIVEHLYGFYGKETAELAVIEAKFSNPLFWIMFTLCFPVPFVILAVPRFRTIPNLFVMSILVNIGMWMERYEIIITSGEHPYLSWGTGRYSPSWVEWSITAGWFAGFALLLLIFVRWFPALTLWEVEEEKHEAPATALPEGVKA
ncbi:MAG: polysulfide reductase NrfD [Planctomycetes bacterium]|nr:polysulfide reductase NrfD [Planctomycetota bacterium]